MDHSSKRLKLRSATASFYKNPGALRRYEFAGDIRPDMERPSCSIRISVDEDYNRTGSVAIKGDRLDEVDICSILSELQDALIDVMEVNDDIDVYDDDEEWEELDDELAPIVDRLIDDEKFRALVQVLMERIAEDDE